ncbi:aminopeptidase N [Flavobacterium arsenatis]|uniref:Aminopeptidase N n=1 Tax=Flavobacterium arsenatis TaxID=1484332 RepID=A0ABU1TN99_9FLAO|nr:M1 family metallopeptidase [Flavobacterium arsenatis]MDR6967423.1 aminopeptidase N [Flavobacterium arsenatis]
MKKIFIITSIVLTHYVSAQNFTRKDSLQGGFSFERMCFDVQRYDLNITINPEERSIVGYNDITFKAIKSSNTIQLDLFENMQVDSIVFEHKNLDYKREFGAVFITFDKALTVDDSYKKLRFYYSGKPIVAQDAPWDGGFVFNKDKNGKPWIGVAVQGTGASLWYPVKDSQSDEPDLGASVKVAVPNGLMNVSNGRFIRSEELKNGYTSWLWEVKNPINNYNITVNIGDYVHLHDKHKDLDLDYYVIRGNEEKAKNHFEEVKPMMDCFQSKFGKYPFAEDGYKLIETPYFGMEHQSAVSYGNKYRKGYLGGDSSGTGIGMLFDYIVIHETGHEWFGNSITSRDIADMWIHEGFTTYSETVFVECLYGYDKAMEYINGQKNLVENRKKIIGSYGVNDKGPTDKYYKGSLLLNTLRHVINDDEKWWGIILKFSENYRHQIIDTETVIAFFNTESQMNFAPVFNQYLHHSNIPVLQIRKKDKGFEYRWKTDVANFEMPVDVLFKQEQKRLFPTNNWKKLDLKLQKSSEIEVLTDEFYIHYESL